jgi:hypothetical protein
MTALDSEGTRFGRYLLDGVEPAPAAVARYVDLIERDARPVTGTDASLLHFARTRPRSIGPIDAALALTAPYAEVRRRLHLMFAILESTPEHHDRFLPERREARYLGVVAGAGARAVARAAIGIPLVRLLRR